MGDSDGGLLWLYQGTNGSCLVRQFNLTEVRELCTSIDGNEPSHICISLIHILSMSQIFSDKNLRHGKAGDEATSV